MDFKQNLKRIEKINDNAFTIKNNLIDVAKEIVATRPYATVAIFCTQDEITVVLELFSALKKFGNKTVVLECGKNAEFSVDTVKDFFTVPENVRAVLVTSEKLLKAVKYYAEIKFVPCFFIPIDGIPLGIYDKTATIVDGEKLYKVRLKSPKVVFVKNKVSASFFESVTLSLLSRLFSLCDIGIDGQVKDAILQAINGLACKDFDRLVNYSFIAEQKALEGCFSTNNIALATYYAYGISRPTTTICKAFLTEYKEQLKKDKFIPPNFNGTAREISLLTGLSLSFTLNKIHKGLLNGWKEPLLDKNLLSVAERALKIYQSEYGKIASPTRREKIAANLAVNNFNILV